LVTGMLTSFTWVIIALPCYEETNCRLIPGESGIIIFNQCW